MVLNAVSGYIKRDLAGQRANEFRKDILVLLINYKDACGRRRWEARIGGFVRIMTKMS